MATTFMPAATGSARTLLGPKFHGAYLGDISEIWSSKDKPSYWFLTAYFVNKYFKTKLIL